MSDLTEGGKALVQAGRRADRPSDADRKRVLLALQARLGDAALLATDSARPPLESSPGGAVSKFFKWGWVGPTVLVAAGAAWFVPRGEHPSEKAQPVPSVSVAPSAVAPMAAAPEPPPSPSTALDAIAPASVGTTEGVSRPLEAQKPAPRTRDGLAEEVALLSRAETDLHAGRPANALVALAEHQRKFPRGALSEERTAARIQALCALGRTDEANAQLRQLLHISPNSALEGRARQACGEPRATSR